MPETLVPLEQMMPLIRERLASGETVQFTTRGTSMRPMLDNGKDQVILSPLPEKLKKFDLPLYRRENGQFVLHRIFKIRNEGYYMMGDRLIDLEGPIEADAIFAIVTEVERNGRWISTDAFCWKFICGAWRALYPVRKLAYRLRKAIRK